jgi:cysteinyl-tRNA synthetase
MATARNPITGQLIKTGHNSAQFQEGYERIFGDKKKKQVDPVAPSTEVSTIEHIEHIEHIENVIARRTEAKANGDQQLVKILESELDRIGVKITDTKAGTSWEIK